MSTVQGLVIETDFTLSLQHIDVDGGDDLRTLVGGWIELAPCSDPEFSFWINEEGKLNGLPLNELGTALWHHTSPTMRDHDVLVGTVVITGGIDSEGVTLTLPAGWPDKLAKILTIEMPEGMTL